MSARGRHARLRCALCDVVLYAAVDLVVDDEALSRYVVRVRCAVDLSDVEQHLAEIHGVTLEDGTG